jgi:hypothetical protein
VKLDLESPVLGTPRLDDELRRMAARCGLKDPWVSAAERTAIKDALGGCPLWMRDPDRGTGRTTRIILTALLAVEAGHRVRFMAPRRLTKFPPHSRTQMTACARRWAEIAGLDADLIGKQINRGGFLPQGMASTLVFEDHSHLHVSRTA